MRFVPAFRVGCRRVLTIGLGLIAHAWRQFLASAVYHGLRHQHPELLVEAVHPAISGGKTVVGDVVPDFESVGLSKRSLCNLRHLHSRWLGGSTGECFSFDSPGIPGFARAAVQPPAHLAA